MIDECGALHGRRIDKEKGRPKRTKCHFVHQNPKGPEVGSNQDHCGGKQLGKVKHFALTNPVKIAIVLS
jgi:hypothetical protein